MCSGFSRESHQNCVDALLVQAICHVLFAVICGYFQLSTKWEDNSGFLLLKVFQYRLASVLTANASMMSVATYHQEIVSSSHLARTAVLLKYLIDVFAFKLNSSLSWWKAETLQLSSFWRQLNYIILLLSSKRKRTSIRSSLHWRKTGARYSRSLGMTAFALSLLLLTYYRPLLYWFWSGGF